MFVFMTCHTNTNKRKMWTPVASRSRRRDPSVKRIPPSCLVSPLQTTFNGTESVFVLDRGKHATIFPERPFESSTVPYQSRINTSSRSLCFRCGYDQHIQNYCPLQFCTLCKRFGHHRQACVAAHHKGAFVRDTDAGPTELRTDSTPEAMLESLTDFGCNPGDDAASAELPEPEHLQRLLNQIFNVEPPSNATIK